MRTRPIFHSSDAAIRGHVFCTFLALVMQKHLDDLATEAGTAPEWQPLYAIWTVFNKRASSITARTGWCAPMRQPWLRHCSARRISRCLPACSRHPRLWHRLFSPENVAAAQGVVPRRHEFRRFIFHIKEFAKCGV